MITDEQITALAREYAEECTNPSGFSKATYEEMVEERAENVTCVLRWLLRRYCLVEKSKVIIKYKNMKRLEEDATAFGFEAHSCNAKVVKNAIESLFPEIEKEVEG